MAIIHGTSSSPVNPSQVVYHSLTALRGIANNGVSLFKADQYASFRAGAGETVHTHQTEQPIGELRVYEGPASGTVHGIQLSNYFVGTFRIASQQAQIVMRELGRQLHAERQQLSNSLENLKNQPAETLQVAIPGSFSFRGSTVEWEVPCSATESSTARVLATQINGRKRGDVTYELEVRGKGQHDLYERSAKTDNPNLREIFKSAQANFKAQQRQ